MRVYIIRHGESETNLSKRWTGWFDANLTPKGIEDAKVAGEFIKDVSFDKIYTSDLKRAIDTAETAIPGCRYEISATLREINVGSLSNIPIENLTLEERKENLKTGYTKYGGESRSQFRERIRSFKKELESLTYDNIAVFTHNGWLRGFLDQVIGTDLSWGNILCKNCAVGIFEFNDGDWKVYSWVNLT